MSRQRLIALAASLVEPHAPFKIGDVVTFKEGLRNRHTSNVMVVTEVLATPVLDPTTHAGSPYFREPLDLKVSYLDDDGDLIEGYADSRRFRLA